MTTNGIVAAAAVFIGVGLTDGAELGSGASLRGEARAKADMPLADVQSRVESLAVERFGTEVLSFVREELKQVWDDFSEMRAVAPETAAMVEKVWRGKGGGTGKDQPTPVLKEEAMVAVWQTYHCIFAERHPLSEEARNRKAEQFRKLRTILAELDDELTARNAELPGALLMGVRDEAQRSIDLLKEYMSSPVYPVFYYPLGDEPFEKAVASIDTAIRKLVENAVDQQAREPKFIVSAKGPTPRTASEQAKWFQNEVKLEHKGNALSALTMGSIARHYGMLERKLDYSDARMFPFRNVNGFGVSYSMGEGISFQIGRDESLASVK